MKGYVDWGWLSSAISSKLTAAKWKLQARRARELLSFFICRWRINWGSIRKNYTILLVSIILRDQTFRLRIVFHPADHNGEFSTARFSGQFPASVPFWIDSRKPPSVFASFDLFPLPPADSCRPEPYFLYFFFVAQNASANFLAEQPQKEKAIKFAAEHFPFPARCPASYTP